MKVMGLKISLSLWKITVVLFLVFYCLSASYFVIFILILYFLWTSFSWIVVFDFGKLLGNILGKLLGNILGFICLIRVATLWKCNAVLSDMWWRQQNYSATFKSYYWFFSAGDSLDLY